MVKTLQAIFDGEVLRPEEPLNIEPNTRVSITIETKGGQLKKPYVFLETARSLKLEGPSDLSDRIDEYLYPVPSETHE